MKTLGYIVAVVGFFVLIGTAGNSDFYEECRAAADCVVEGSPPSMLQITLQGLAGLALMLKGLLWAGVWAVWVNFGGAHQRRVGYAAA